jgi:hypothetical protein
MGIVDPQYLNESGLSEYDAAKQRGDMLTPYDIAQRNGGQLPSVRSTLEGAFRLNGETAARMTKQAEEQAQRAYLNGFNNVPGGKTSNPADYDFSASMAELVKAIKQGAILPLDFKPLINKHVDSEFAAIAKYEPLAAPAQTTWGA